MQAAESVGCCTGARRRVAVSFVDLMDGTARDPSCWPVEVVVCLSRRLHVVLSPDFFLSSSFSFTLFWRIEVSPSITVLPVPSEPSLYLFTHTTMETCVSPALLLRALCLGDRRSSTERY